MKEAAIVPAEGDLLCEGCGYTLNTLPLDSRCPECGKPINDSVGGARRPTAWDTPGGVMAWLAVSAQTLFRPRRFFQTLAVRVYNDRARRFGRLHRLLTALFFAVAGSIHLGWLVGPERIAVARYAMIALFINAYVVIAVVTFLVRRLSAMEASYRGLRLPLDVVQRTLDYHSVHLVPVGFLGAATATAFTAMIRTNTANQYLTQYYLYTLCAEVVLFSFYLFWTYWIAMRSVLYANR